MWPAFALVTGLLLVGVVAEQEGLFARARGLDESPFLYGVVFMSNAASLFLSGRRRSRRPRSRPSSCSSSSGGSCGATPSSRTSRRCIAGVGAVAIAGAVAVLGLNIGPNLAVIGSLCAFLWLRIARSLGARPSAARYSRLGIVLVPLSLAAALAVLRF